MLPLPDICERLYRCDGQHIGGIYPPLLEDDELTDAYRAEVAARPVQRLIHDAQLCPADPHRFLGFVWMAPASDNPLAVSPNVFPHLVQALDAGRSVMVHASSEAAIDDTCARLLQMIGGGHV